MPRATKVKGPVCKHAGCRQPIERRGTRHPYWVHTATDTVWCADNLPGLTARFADPG